MSDPVTGLKFGEQGVRHLSEQLKKLAGTANRIEGTLSENMHYAPYIEFGTSNDDGSTRMAARPHMRPAWQAMMQKAAPVLHKVLGNPQSFKDYDKACMEAVTAAMYEMEAQRVYFLRQQVYTAMRFARERVKDYKGYKLTGNLLNNRTVTIRADKGPSPIEPNLPKLAVGA